MQVTRKPSVARDASVRDEQVALHKINPHRTEKRSYGLTVISLGVLPVIYREYRPQDNISALLGGSVSPTRWTPSPGSCDEFRAPGRAHFGPSAHRRVRLQPPTSNQSPYSVRSVRSRSATAGAKPSEGSDGDDRTAQGLKVRMTRRWRGESRANPSLLGRFPGNSEKYRELCRFRPSWRLFAPKTSLMSVTCKAIPWTGEQGIF